LSVDGRIVKIKVNKNKNLSHIVYKGDAVKNVSVESYIKIVKGFIEIIGKVEGEFITEEKYFNKNYGKEETKINRILQISLFGHFEDAEFKQGIKEVPLIDNECYLLDREEFNALHSFYGKGERTIKIGHLTDEPSQSIALSINKLFASHVGIFGNTGSGKSNTLARIFTELFKECGSEQGFKENSKFVIIDFNGEYAAEQIITQDKDIYKLSTGKKQGGKYVVKKTSIKKLEILSVLLEATEKTQKPFLSRALKDWHWQDDKDFNQGVILEIENIFKDILKQSDRNLRLGIFTEFFNHLENLVSNYTEILSITTNITGHLTWHGKSECYVYTDDAGISIYSNNDPESKIFEWLKSLISNLKFKEDEFSKLRIKIILNYYQETIKGFSNQEHIGPLIGRMFKKFNMLEKLVEIEDDTKAGTRETAKNLIIISLRDVNLEMKKIIPLVICKQLYDEKKDEDENRKKSLHIIIDEAHNILSTMSQRESETWKDYRLETFEEIIKEGRKFGVFLTIASQRPYDISPTIISQLHNYFIHRLINENDIQAIEKTVAYLDKLSFQSISILSVGSCFVAGLASDIPVKVDIDFLEDEKQRPMSETINLQKAWK
jgi:hypothetical protein